MGKSKDHVLELKFIELNFLKGTFQEKFLYDRSSTSNSRTSELWKRNLFAVLYGRKGEGCEIVKGIKQFGSEYGKSKTFFSLLRKSVQALGLNNTPIQLVPGPFPRGSAAGA